jgi:beta-lactamase class A
VSVKIALAAALALVVAVSIGVLVSGRIGVTGEPPEEAGVASGSVPGSEYQGGGENTSPQSSWAGERAARVAELSAAIEDLLAGVPAQLSVSLYRPAEGMLFARHQDDAYPLASAIKLYILGAYLTKVRAEERELDSDEIANLQSMIEWSDNDAAEILWWSLGGAEGLRAYLQGAGFRGIDVPQVPDAGWGDAADTSKEMALYLARLTSGELLDPADTTFATGLLSGVEEDQRWGVPARVEDIDPDANVLVKNGWYPSDEGWRINSAGQVYPGDGEPPYVLVIFGNGFETYEEGVRVVESIAALANGFMLNASAAVPPGP